MTAADFRKITQFLPAPGINKPSSYQRLGNCCRLISRLPDASRKAEEYAAIGLLQEAAEAAAQVQRLTCFVVSEPGSIPQMRSCLHPTSPCCQPADACLETLHAFQMSRQHRSPHPEGRRPLAGSCTPLPPATAAVCLQVQDSAMLTRIQGMVGVGSPLSAAVTQLKDRITSAATR